MRHLLSFRWHSGLILLLVGTLTALAQPTATAPATAPASQPQPRLLPSAGGGTVEIIVIDREITNITARIVKRGIERAKEKGAKVIVFEMDTPGGLVTSAMDISKQIKDLKSQNIATVAWVHPDAISAGALISLACGHIVIAPGGKIGDCAPIMIGPQGLQEMGQVERAKVNSYILSEFRDSAVRNGYPQTLCQTMVELSPAVYRVLNSETGETRYVFAGELHTYGLSEPGKESATRPATSWRIDKLILPENKLLTMIHDEAIEYGFAAGSAPDDAALRRLLNAGAIERIEATWSEALADFLTSPAVRSLLIMVLIIGVYMEMQAPGVSLPGIAAALALTILLVAPFLAGLATMMDVAMIFVGLVLLAVEIFLIPGFGVTGILGLILIFAGLVLSFVPPEPGPGWVPTLPYTYDRLIGGLVSVLVGSGVAIVAVTILSRYFGVLPVFNRLILAGATTAGWGPVPGHADLPGVAVGDAGQAVTRLRPAGKARINDKLVDVVADGDWIAAGANIKVVQVAGNRVAVEEV